MCNIHKHWQHDIMSVVAVPIWGRLGKCWHGALFSYFFLLGATTAGRFWCDLKLLPSPPLVKPALSVVEAQNTDASEVLTLCTHRPTNAISLFSIHVSHPLSLLPLSPHSHTNHIYSLIINIHTIIKIDFTLYFTFVLNLSQVSTHTLKLKECPVYCIVCYAMHYM